MFTVLLPMSLLFQIDPPKIALAFTLLIFWGYFVHLDWKLNLGPLTSVFAGPQYHRIHHSIEKVHRNHNYAAFFPIFDRLFKSQYLPHPNEWPETGIDDLPVADRWSHGFWSPLIAWSKMLRATLSKPLMME